MTKVLDLARCESESFWKLEMAYTVETNQPVSPVFSLSFGMTVTIKFAMAATTKPITTTFFRPNLTKKSEKKCYFPLSALSGDYLPASTYLYLCTCFPSKDVVGCCSLKGLSCVTKFIKIQTVETATKLSKT